jgi:hypothetical protein
MIEPTQLQLSFAMAAAREAIRAYSVFYNGLISDAMLEPVIRKAIMAAINTKVSK